MGFEKEESQKEKKIHAKSITSLNNRLSDATDGNDGKEPLLPQNKVAEEQEDNELPFLEANEFEPKRTKSSSNIKN